MSATDCFSHNGGFRLAKTAVGNGAIFVSRCKDRNTGKYEIIHDFDTCQVSLKCAYAEVMAPFVASLIKVENAPTVVYYHMPLNSS